MGGNFEIDGTPNVE